MGNPITIVDNDKHLGYSVGNVKNNYIITQATNDFIARVNMVKSHFKLVPPDIMYKQGNQRWQIPRTATGQCLATFTPLKYKFLIFFRDVISLLAQVFILLIDTATQEVPMRNI